MGDRADVRRAVYRAVYVDDYRAFLVYQCCMLVKLWISIQGLKQSFERMEFYTKPCAKYYAELLQSFCKALQQNSIAITSIRFNLKIKLELTEKARILLRV